MQRPFLVRHDRADGDPLDAAREPSGPDVRWVLVGRGVGVDACRAAAVRALSGRERVFGLAGLVLVGTETPADAPTPAGLPVLRLATEDESAIDRWWTTHAGPGPRLAPELLHLLASDRVSTRTRAAHAARILADDPAYRPRALDPAGLAVLREVADLVVPQPGPAEEHLDLAARVDAQLAAGAGDGWRPADNPPDVEAYRAGLAELGAGAGVGPEALEAAAGDEGPLGRWFEDCRTDLVRQWLAHPASMARIGYDGFANGGDEPVRQGYVDLVLGRRDDWEPAALAAGSLR